jgi:PHD/YefM family antitoxin component YafN of YafNO toxin-antitoxin module
MLKVTEDEIACELGSYLHRAVTQTVVVEKADRNNVVVLSLAEFQRLQEVDEQHWEACARQANVEGYLDHDHEVRQRLATAMRNKRLACLRKAPGNHL